MFTITGNTYPVKDQLKQMGCKWNADQKCWVAPNKDVYDKAKAIVPEAKTTTTYTTTSSPYKAKGPTKTCWECGCKFTFADAKRNGDWGSSYCGC
jgi:Txe/YoeB family toxin of Txe-Axe toxin-antitoxin module